jgi:hypothetical protein
MVKKLEMILVLKERTLIEHKLGHGVVPLI